MRSTRRIPLVPLALGLATLAAALLAPARGAGAQTPYFSKVAVNRCMDVSGGRRDAGAPLIIWECNNGENQRFTHTGTEIRIFGMCVDALGGQGRDGDRIGLWPCTGGANQRWQWTGQEFRGINGKCIDVQGGNSALGTPLLLWSCNSALNQRWSQGPSAGGVTQAGAAVEVKKLYVIDGTNSLARHQNSLYHFYEMWVGPKTWQDGVDQFATNVNGAYQQMYNTICQDVRSASQGGGGVTKVYLAGYSRGAIMAIRLANEVRSNCGAEVAFLALVDAVNSSLDTRTWPLSVPRALSGTKAIHIRKPRQWEHVLTTIDPSGVFTINHPQNVDHQEIVCNKNNNDQGWRWTREQLVYYARQHGGVFSAPQRDRTAC